MLIPGTRQERQYVQFFCSEATSAISGFFPSELWNRFLPQLSHQNPTLRHAAAAVGAAYEQYTFRAPGEKNVTEGFALQQYNKAIQHFRDEILKPEGSQFDVMLMTCALFSCLEMLRSNQHGAMDHVQGGLKILLSKLRSAPSQPSKSITARNNFDRDLFQFFYRMDLQVSLSGRQQHFSEVPLEDPTARNFFLDETLIFENISQARDCITSLKLRALTLLHEIGFILTAPPVPPSAETLTRKQRLIEDFHRWKPAFEKMMQKPPQSIGILDPRAPLTLQIEYHVSYFWLCKCNARYETEYDEHRLDFETIVNCAESIISLGKILDSKNTTPDTNTTNTTSLSPRRRFFMEAPITPSLYWTAYKCRDPIIRRRAIRAILDFPSCQGGWENRRHAATAYRIMEIEEGPVWHLPVSERFVKNEWRVIEPLQSSANVKDGEGVDLLLLMRPFGPDGDVVERQEFVEWWVDIPRFDWGADGLLDY